MSAPATEMPVNRISAVDPAAVVRRVDGSHGPWYRVDFVGQEKTTGLEFIRHGIGSNSTDVWAGKPRKDGSTCYQCRTQLPAGTLLIFRHTGFKEPRETWCLDCARSHYGVWRSVKTTEREIPVPPTLYFGLDAKLRYGQLPG